MRDASAAVAFATCQLHYNRDCVQSRRNQNGAQKVSHNKMLKRNFNKAVRQFGKAEIAWYETEQREQQEEEREEEREAYYMEEERRWEAEYERETEFYAEMDRREHEREAEYEKAWEVDDAWLAYWE